LPADHYWLQRPVPSGYRDFIERTYAYGSTAGGLYRPHTGVEFFNPLGTPVVAVANATVYFAGTDHEALFGPQQDFYGNLIVLQLSDVVYNGQSVFAVYGHLSEVQVETGQSVPAGEGIGLVGGTGVANGGTHLHFEVRIGDPLGYFTSTRNPDLWIQPYPGYGTLAGRITDSSGMLLPNVSLTIRGDGAVRYTWTYAGAENIPDDAWGENFTYGDLPEGWYTVTTSSGSKTYREEIYIRSGQTTWLELVFDS
jgi:murein DD-endopeptidase MepM/ murein hydrolase activator NlpD